MGIPEWKRSRLEGWSFGAGLISPYIYVCGYRPGESQGHFVPNKKGTLNPTSLNLKISFVSFSTPAPPTCLLNPRISPLSTPTARTLPSLGPRAQASAPVSSPSSLKVLKSLLPELLPPQSIDKGGTISSILRLRKLRLGKAKSLAHQSGLADPTAQALGYKARNRSFTRRSPGREGGHEI